MKDKHITLKDVEYLPDFGCGKVYYEENGSSKIAYPLMTAEQFSDRDAVYGLLLKYLGMNTKEDKHYDNTNGSLYKIAIERGWNAYQFDAVKRIDRALKKGQFEEDIRKTKRVLDLWEQEK